MNLSLKVNKWKLHSRFSNCMIHGGYAKYPSHKHLRVYTRKLRLPIVVKNCCTQKKCLKLIAVHFAPLPPIRIRNDLSRFRAARSVSRLVLWEKKNPSDNETPAKTVPTVVVNRSNDDCYFTIMFVSFCVKFVTVVQGRWGKRKSRWIYCEISHVYTHTHRPFYLDCSALFESIQLWRGRNSSVTSFFRRAANKPISSISFSSSEFQEYCG